MAKNQHTFAKRQREMEKRRKAEEKRNRRQNKNRNVAAVPTDAPDDGDAEAAEATRTERPEAALGTPERPLSINRT
jgi:hypothetical protein